MTHLPIYLDYAATTPVDTEVAKAMMQCLTMDGNFGNPASRSHIYGWKSEEAVELARQQVAKLVGADAREIVWTSGATESNNLALKGVVDAFTNSSSNSSNRYDRADECHIVVSSIEHKAVLDAAESLAERGVSVSYVKPTKAGVIETEKVEAELRDNTVLVSIMHANNETGAINPIAEIGALCRSRGILFHTDAAQTCGKLSLDVTELNIDLLSMCAHKMYGPKGIGALFVRRHPSVKVGAQIHGGGHERGMRSGTLATHQIVGFGKASELALNQNHNDHLRSVRDHFWNLLKTESNILLNTVFENSLAGHLNLAFDGMDGETLLMSLRDLAISSGSACMSTTMAPSYVLTEMGYSQTRAQSSLRFSFGRFTTINDAQQAAEKVKHAVACLGRARA